MEQIVCLEIDFGVRPLSHILELDHDLADRNVIPVSSIGGPSVSFMNPVMNHQPCPFNVGHIKKGNYTRSR